MNIVEMRKDESVKEALQFCLKRADQFECVMIVALNSDGRQFLRSSHCSGMQKSFMISFAQSWLNKWFGLEDV